MIEQQSDEIKLPPLRIKESGDIFNALVSPDFGIRVSIARAIAVNPGKAISYGSYNGMELVDYLIHLLDINQDTSYRPVLLSALAVFRDPRIPVIFMNIMEKSADTETITITSCRLAVEKDEHVRCFMSKMLWRSTSTPHSRMAANVMSDYEDLTPEETVRIAVITDAPFTIPPVDDTTIEAWCDELEGDASEQAMRLIETFGEDAFIRIAKKRKTFDNRIFKWLIKWSSAEFPAYAVTLINEALESEDELRNLDALIACRIIHTHDKQLYKKLPLFVEHKNPAIRKAAINAGAPLKKIRSMLVCEENKEIKLALISRLPEERGHLDTLADLLADSQWEIRSTAVSTLIAAGKNGVKAVKHLINSNDQHIRAAVIQVLAASDDLKLSENIVKNSIHKDITDK